MSEEMGRSEQEILTEANEIMLNMAHSFGLNSTKAVGYLVLKCLMVWFKKYLASDCFYKSWS
jgi:hypothetical protein